MRIALVVDAFNVYYAAREVCGRHRRGWKWIDLGALAERKLVAWSGGRITEIHYAPPVEAGRVRLRRSTKTRTWVRYSNTIPGCRSTSGSTWPVPSREC